MGVNSKKRNHEELSKTNPELKGRFLMSARKFAAFVLIFFLSLVSVHASETKQDAVELEGVTVIGTQPGEEI